MEYRKILIERAKETLHELKSLRKRLPKVGPPLNQTAHRDFLNTIDSFIRFKSTVLKFTCFHTDTFYENFISDCEENIREVAVRVNKEEFKTFRFAEVDHRQYATTTSIKYTGASKPSNPVKGSVYFDYNHIMWAWDGQQWVKLI